MASATETVASALPHDVSPAKIVHIAVSALSLLLLAALSAVYWHFGALGAAFLVMLLAFGTVRWVYWNGVGVGGWKWSWLRTSSAVVNSLKSDPQQKGTLRFVCISDTHGRHRNVQDIPDGDVLVHCGDFTNRGTHKEICDFNDWLGSLPHRHKIVIAGNHDLSMDAAEYDVHWQAKWRHDEYNDPTQSRALLTNCTYVENRSVVIDGIKIYGSPMTPPIPGRVMAFNVARGFAAQQQWSKIPSDVDVLLTHGPPNGILDKVFTGARVGDETLLKEVMSRCRPRFHVFGHIHEAYGATRVGTTVFINCATSTLLGKPKHAPVVFDIPAKC
uniref:Calcineurin-like phosphoesterase domain-containing protein n=1 Tax=Globisporangium ultimum (strain ATCC 200006 / CBS 805.95 / DAOM BR144) TaxID=431595 RepID=K3X2D5_GLOUD